MLIKSLLPFLVWFKLIDKKSIKADFIAGLTGAVIVLPQGIAFSSIAGLPPQYGLYTAMVTPIVAALFGSSFHLVSGPTTAISIVVFAAVSGYAQVGTPEFIALALTLTFMAGIFQLAFGLARLGALVNFVSHTVVVGFTAGAAILIITSQIKHITQLSVASGDSFVVTWINLFNKLEQTNLAVLAIALVTIISAIVSKKLWPKIPNLLVGMVVASLVAIFLNKFNDGIEFVGQITHHLPSFSSPSFSFETIKILAPEAFAIALLGLIEAVSISRSIATRSNQRINANQEFIGQGMSNIVGSFFSSYAGSGSFTRSGVNYEVGAKTPLSAIFSALVLMAIVLLIAPLTAYLPIAAMGGVILVVAYHLIDFIHIRQVLSFSKSESSILLTTFFSTLFLDLEFAIYLGVILSLTLFLAKTSTPRIPTLSIDNSGNNPKRKLINIQKMPLKQCPQLKMIRIDMSIYFGSINHIQKRIAKIVENEKIKHILIIGSGINFIDLAGAEALVAENERLKIYNGGIYFVGLKMSVYKFAVKASFIEKLGADHFFDSKTTAIDSIYRKLNKIRCKECRARIFKECSQDNQSPILATVLKAKEM